jgi:hypothetical protein
MNPPLFDREAAVPGSRRVAGDVMVRYPKTLTLWASGPARLAAGAPFLKAVLAKGV